MEYTVAQMMISVLDRVELDRCTGHSDITKILFKTSVNHHKSLGECNTILSAILCIGTYDSIALIH